MGRVDVDDGSGGYSSFRLHLEPESAHVHGATANLPLYPLAFFPAKLQWSIDGETFMEAPVRGVNGLASVRCVVLLRWKTHAVEAH